MSKLSCLWNIALTILHEAGGSIETIGMTIVYVTDLSIKDQVNKVFGEYFALKILLQEIW